MKKTFILLHALIAVYALAAAPRISALNDGFWQTPATWNLARVPASLDTIIIPVGKVVTINNNESLGNVYMMVYGTLYFSTGKLFMGTNSTVMIFPGGIIMGTGSNSEKMRIGNTEVFRGSDAAVSGPMFADQTTGGGFSSFTLPVKFLGFSVNAGRDAVIIHWSTAEEVNADRYEIERSVNGNNWTRIASIQASGNTTATSNYSYSDESVLTLIVYYRIRQVDIDGRFVYTPVKVIRGDAHAVASNIKIAAIHGNVVLQFPKQITSTLFVRFITLGGQIIENHSLTNAFGQIILRTENCVRGNIVVSVDNGRGIYLATQVVL